MAKIVVIDGQGGGFGRSLIEKLRAGGYAGEVIAVGTNAAATAAMLKAGASAGATGENAVIWNAGKAQIIAGKLAPGEALPSIRALAKDLRISVITTKRAYDELEADGFLYTVAGKGCFVAEKNLDLIREQKLKELEDHLDAAVELAAQCGVSASELMEMLRILLKEEEPHV